MSGRSRRRLVARPIGSVWCCRASWLAVTRQSGSRTGPVGRRVHRSPAPTQGRLAAKSYSPVCWEESEPGPASSSAWTSGIRWVCHRDPSYDPSLVGRSDAAVHPTPRLDLICELGDSPCTGCERVFDHLGSTASLGYSPDSAALSL